MGPLIALLTALAVPPQCPRVEQRSLDVIFARDKIKHPKRHELFVPPLGVPGPPLRGPPFVPPSLLKKIENLLIRGRMGPTKGLDIDLGLVRGLWVKALEALDVSCRLSKFDAHCQLHRRLKRMPKWKPRELSSAYPSEYRSTEQRPIDLTESSRTTRLDDHLFERRVVRARRGALEWSISCGRDPEVSDVACDSRLAESGRTTLQLGIDTYGMAWIVLKTACHRFGAFTDEGDYAPVRAHFGPSAPEQNGPREACGYRPDVPMIAPKVSASSAHPKYPVAWLSDGRFETAWVEGDKNGAGRGQVVRATYDQPVSSATVRFAPGYIKSKALYFANARPKRVKISSDAEEHAFVTLPDRPVIFDFTLQARQPFKTLTLSIEDIYPGTKYEDGAISELTFRSPQRPPPLSQARCPVPAQPTPVSSWSSCEDPIIDIDNAGRFEGNASRLCFCRDRLVYRCYPRKPRCPSDQRKFLVGETTPDGRTQARAECRPLNK